MYLLLKLFWKFEFVGPRNGLIQFLLFWRGKIVLEVERFGTRKGFWNGLSSDSKVSLYLDVFCTVTDIISVCGSIPIEIPILWPRAVMVGPRPRALLTLSLTASTLCPVNCPRRPQNNSKRKTCGPDYPYVRRSWPTVHCFARLRKYFRRLIPRQWYSDGWWTMFCSSSGRSTCDTW